MTTPLTIPVAGMTCEGCVRALTRVLEASPAIKQTTVTLEPPQARILFQAAPLPQAEINALIRQAGFEPA